MATEGQSNGKIRRFLKTLFPGTKAEQKVQVGRTIVRADAQFVSTEVTPFGPDDAAAIRAERDGKPAPVPFWKRAAASRERVAEMQRKKMAERKLGNDGSTQTVVVQAAPAPGGLDPELAAQLAAFADEPEMQTKILAKWQKKRAAEAAARKTAEAVGPSAPAPAGAPA